MYGISIQYTRQSRRQKYMMALLSLTLFLNIFFIQSRIRVAATEQTDVVPMRAVSVSLKWKESVDKEQTDWFYSGNIVMCTTVNGVVAEYPVCCQNGAATFLYNGNYIWGSYSKTEVSFASVPSQDIQGSEIVWKILIRYAPKGYSFSEQNGQYIFTEDILSKYVLNKTKVTLKDTREVTLKIKSCSENVTWSTSNAKVATVSKKGLVKAVKKGTCTITAKTKHSGMTFQCKVTVKNPQTKWVITIPRYDQKKAGYILGCEGVSFYMALQAQGYLEDMTLDEFMDTQPKATKKSKYNPNTGYAGDPRYGHKYAQNVGKRTTIYPKALVKWGKSFDANVKNLQGADVEKLQKEIKNGNPCLIWVTSQWKAPKYKKYSFSKKLQVENNHCLVLTGYNSKTGKYHITDCSRFRTEDNCRYWIDGKTFENIYNIRKYAVSVRKK